MQHSFWKRYVHNGNLRRFRIVVPSEFAASQQLGSQRAEETWRNLIVDDRDAVRRFGIRFIGGKNAASRKVPSGRGRIGEKRGLSRTDTQYWVHTTPFESAGPRISHDPRRTTNT